MSEDDYQRIVEHVLQNAAQPMISTDTGVEAARKAGELAAQEESKKAALSGEWLLKEDYTTQEERDKQERLKQENRQREEAERSLAQQLEDQKKDFLAAEELLKQSRRKEEVDKERKEFQEIAADSVDRKWEKQDEKVKNEKQLHGEVHHPSSGGWYKGIDLETVDVTAVGLFAAGALIHATYEKFKDWREKTEKTINDGLTREPSANTARDNAALELSNKEEMELQQLNKEQDEQKKALETKYEQIEKVFNQRHEFTDPVKRAELWEKLQEQLKAIEKQRSENSIDQRDRLLQQQDRRREDEFGGH